MLPWLISSPHTHTRCRDWSVLHTHVAVIDQFSTHMLLWLISSPNTRCRDWSVLHPHVAVIDQFSTHTLPWLISSPHTRCRDWSVLHTRCRDLSVLHANAYIQHLHARAVWQWALKKHWDVAMQYICYVIIITFIICDNIYFTAYEIFCPFPVLHCSLRNNVNNSTLRFILLFMIMLISLVVIKSVTLFTTALWKGGLIRRFQNDYSCYQVIYTLVMLPSHIYISHVTKSYIH